MTFLNVNHTPDVELRRKIINTAQKMNVLGINQGKSGNVSARVENGFLITPTGIPYDETKPEQIVETHFDGSFAGDVLPSSEWRFHADIYRARADVDAIVHTHSTFATTLACVVDVVPDDGALVLRRHGRADHTILYKGQG